jgi:hypothetical protein
MHNAETRGLVIALMSEHRVKHFKQGCQTRGLRCQSFELYLHYGSTQQFERFAVSLVVTFTRAARQKCHINIYRLLGGGGGEKKLESHDRKVRGNFTHHLP